MCSKQWEHYFKPLRKDGLIAWFKSVNVFPCKATVANLMEMVWGQKKFIVGIFDSAESVITKHNIESMFMQLIAAGPITAERQGYQLGWNICKKKHNSPFFSLCHIKLMQNGMESFCKMDPRKENIH